MILDALINLFGWLGNITIGAILRTFGNSVTVDASVSAGFAGLRGFIHYVDMFLPFTELRNCLSLLVLIISIWGMFKLWMWVLAIFRIGKKY